MCELALSKTEISRISLSNFFLHFFMDLNLMCVIIDSLGRSISLLSKFNFYFNSYFILSKIKDPLKFNSSSLHISPILTKCSGFVLI